MMLYRQIMCTSVYLSMCPSLQACISECKQKVLDTPRKLLGARLDDGLLRGDQREGVRGKGRRVSGLKRGVFSGPFRISG